MTTSTNAFGEKVTKWESHKHPDNADFMQIVLWTVWEKQDGRTLVGYKLNGNGKTIFLYNLNKEQAIEKFS
jgi:hypothetical protein